MPLFAGTENRAHPRVNVMRGYTGNEPQSLSRSAPVAADDGGTTATGSVLSGQAVVLNADEEWVLADGGQNDDVVYIAYHDSTDPDVLACNKLLAFSTLGQYELETGFVANPDAAAEGLVITISHAAPGSVDIGDAEATGGTVIGRCSTAAIDLAGADDETNGGANQRGGARPLAEDSTSDSGVVVRLTTTAS